ncbi:MFS transporter [Motilimonas sp. 1_MG-2023]|uniref:MFS transporter n=1 Tax=Motilimonas sp. 1_MG-2023 TaxID=3062672 RepID=UPI0026E22819|nr:MFS transporter [Motilimonas sp. 1_MG-2023]MDO6525555.1 MFS transporter [Motilimonas sp. 1_MG-2023]
MSLLQNKNFILHWLSVSLAQLGGYFTMVALPWLVLSQTNNDAFLMSIVMACFSLPHGFFILFGGALADRWSPLLVLFRSRQFGIGVMLCLAACVYLQITPIPVLCVFGLILGTLGAFGIPASQSILPSICKDEELGLANGIVMGTSQLAQIVGPLLAGWLIWLMRYLNQVNPEQYDSTSLALAFVVDAGLVLISICLLYYIQVKPVARSTKGLFTLVFQGMQFCWLDQGIRLVLAYLILISFFMHGPLLAVLPLIAKVDLSLTEAGYGTLYAMIGVGTLIGAGMAIWLRPAPDKLGLFVLIGDLTSGISLFLLGFVSASLISVSICLIVMGIATGFIMIAGTTWFQRRTPNEYMGRVMSVLMFCILGLMPLSGAIAGFFNKHYGNQWVVMSAGSLIITFALLGLMLPKVRRMGKTPEMSVASISKLSPDAQAQYELGVVTKNNI